MHRCPRDEEKFLKPDGIYDVECSGCGEAVEFFADDAKQKCHKCGLVLVNPGRWMAE
ncbi:MAG: FmdB family zinc ribbon protein [Planctomycetota bacterium]|jgi:ribosomal protein S27E